MISDHECGKKIVLEIINSYKLVPLSTLEVATVLITVFSFEIISLQHAPLLCSLNITIYFLISSISLFWCCHNFKFELHFSLVLQFHPNLDCYVMNQQQV